MFSSAQGVRNDPPEAIKHVVVLMFENRSFDHLFGAFPGVNGISRKTDA